MKTQRTILLVDDMPLFRELGALFLAASGQVVTAASASEALAIAQRSAPDLVVTDLRLPGMDGAALCRALKRDPDLAHVPVIAVLADGDPKEHARAVRAGADDVLTKPLERDALIASARRFLRFCPARGLPRVELAELVRLRSGERESWGKLRNLSRGGLFVETEHEFDPQTEIDLLFSLPDEGTEFASTAAVVWQRSAGTEAPGLGLRFLEVDRSTEQRLDEFVYERSPARPGFANGSAS